MRNWQWWKCAHGLPTDPRWKVIGKKAGVSGSLVCSVVMALHDWASQAERRDQSRNGCVKDFDVEMYADQLGVDEGEVRRVMAALPLCNVINTDGFLVGWKRIQAMKPKDPGAGSRQERRRSLNQEFDERFDRIR
jgi:hypothetical protein